MKWRFVVRRDLALLFRAFIRLGDDTAHMKEYLGVDFGFDQYLTIDGYVFVGESDCLRAERKIAQHWRNEGQAFFRQLLEKWYAYFDHLLKTAQELAASGLGSKANSELADMLETLTLAYAKASSSLNFPLTFGNFAEKKILHFLKKRNAIRYFGVLTSPSKETETSLEIKEIRKIAELHGQGADISENIKQHIRAFGWINSKGFIGDSWTEQEIRQRVAEYEQVPIEQEPISVEEALKIVGGGREFAEFVRLTREFVFFRTYRMDMFTKAGIIAMPFFQEIAARLGIGFKDMLYLTPYEIISCLRGDKKQLRKISRRKKGYVLSIRNGRMAFIDGVAVERFRQKFVPAAAELQGGELKGTGASPGKAKGMAKILAAAKDMAKVEKGDILVTSMTTPNLVPAMERAAAFVTDEGGILCHAAIMAREMGKPCVIGTKIATKALKDGDQVEVDADKGIVRIIQRAKPQ